MEEEVYIYKPKRMFVGLFCVALIVLLMGNMYMLSEYNTVWLYIPLLIMLVAFVILIHPVVKNQKILLSGKKMFLFTFGRHSEIDIETDLDEVVVRRGEVVSYRFEKSGMYFQISPASYHDHLELKTNLEDTLKRYNLNISEFSR